MDKTFKDVFYTFAFYLMRKDLALLMNDRKFLEVDLSASRLSVILSILENIRTEANIEGDKERVKEIDYYIELVKDVFRSTL